MPSLSERLTDGYCEHTHGGYLCPDCRRNAAAVCAAVEAFQAAEQARRVKLAAESLSTGLFTTHEYEVAVARLLEVNLG
jgi:hypothetical protein